MILALISGTLYRDPEQRTGKNAPFAVATVKWVEDGRPQYAKALAFDDEARSTLMDLAKGDALSITGRLEVELFEKEGQLPRVTLKIVADKILPLKPRSRRAVTANGRNFP